MSSRLSQFHHTSETIGSEASAAPLEVAVDPIGHRIFEAIDLETNLSRRIGSIWLRMRPDKRRTFLTPISKALLGLVVLLKSLVVIEVIATEGGDRSGGQGKPADPLLIDAMG